AGATSPSTPATCRRSATRSTRYGSDLCGRVRALLLALGLAQLDPADLAGQRLRQVRHELDLARIGVRGVALAHEELDLLGVLVLVEHPNVPAGNRPPHRALAHLDRGEVAAERVALR